MGVPTAGAGCPGCQAPTMPPSAIVPVTVMDVLNLANLVTSTVLAGDLREPGGTCPGCALAMHRRGEGAARAARGSGWAGLRSPSRGDRDLARHELGQF